MNSADQLKRRSWRGGKGLAFLAGVLLAVGVASPALRAASAPTAPTNLTATALATNAIQLTWHDNSSNEQGFYIDRTTNGFQNTVEIGVNANVTSYLDTNLLPGVTYTYRVRAWNSRGSSAYSNTDSATTFAPPAISQPPTNQTVLAGATVTFSVTATGTAPLGYQWQFNSADLSGATNSSLLLTNVQPADEGSYAVVVTNSEGSVTSAVAVLRVLVRPAITAQPQSLTNLAGTSASFSATATGTTPLIYQWQLNGLKLANGGRISGATTNALTIASVLAGDVGSYTLVVSNAAGVITSAVATLTVLTPPGIASQPASQSVALGNNVLFSVTASGTLPLNYQWQKNGTDLADGANLSGTITATLRLQNVQTNDAGDYQVVVTNSLGSVTSAVASLAVGPPFQPVSQSAGVVVLVNSQSARYPDFQHFIQPYLDNFGFPYTVLDLTTNAPGQSISNCAVIIIGHSQLDTNRTYLSAAVQANLSLAVSNGTGLVSFDNDLYSGGAPRYQFVQDIFGFGYGSGAAGTNASLPPTEPLSQMHYITARHPTNDLIPFRASVTLPGITVPATAKTLARVGGQPLVAVAKCGQGRAVQWGSYDWMVSTVRGPVDGLDDLVWRGVVWAARKPCVMRGLPSFVTMRVDDVSGPFAWLHTANALGFKPFVALFYLLVSDSSAADLAALTTSGQATASIHSTGDLNSFFYFNHAAEQPWPDNVQSNNFYLGTQWHLSHGIPISRICATHWSEVGLNCFAGLKAWGIEYVPIEVVPGTIEYTNPGAPWVVNGPYRLYETPQPGQVSWPTYYADWLKVPGHPEFDGQFFNVYSEVRDAASCGEWCPDNSDVAGSISRATQIAKRGLDSMVMTTIFTHEHYILPISTTNWQAILQGITNNLAPYQPSYVTLDYASQYVRATRTSRLVSSALDPGSGQVTATFSGKTDLDTQVYVFLGTDDSITANFGAVPAFSASGTNPVVTFGPPVIMNAPSGRTNLAGTTTVFSVGASGLLPLSCRWYRNGTNALTDGGQITGAGGTTLTISNLLGGNAGSYTVVITNALGSATSTAPAVLTVIDPIIATQLVNQTNIAGTTTVFSVGAYGTTPAYQWLKNGVPISGATNTTLSLTNVSASDAGGYSVAVSNAYGSAVSSSATLSVFYVPVANNDSYGVATGTTLAVAAPGVLGNDTVAGVGDLAARMVSGPIHGALSLNPDGGFTYTPLTNYVGADSFSYQAVNGPTNSGVATVTISMTAGGVWFSDGFTRLADPGPLSPWVVQSGNWAVTGGALQAGTNTVRSYGYAYLTNSWTNYSVEGRIEFSATGVWGGGIGGRLNPATGAHYAAWVYPEGSPGGSNVVKLIKFQTWTSFGYTNSSGAAMATASVAATGTNWHTVKLAFHGNQIAVYYDGNRVMSARDTEAQPYSSGGISADMWTYLLLYTMSVRDVVVRPLVVDDSYGGTMGTPLSVADPGILGNDTGVYTTNLVAALVSAPTNGTLTLGTNGGFTYSPATNYYGTDSFNYQASQGSNNLGTATVMITVMPDLPLLIRTPSSRTNIAGTTAVFSAAALGTSPLSYQWFWNGTNSLTDAGKVSGAGSATLTISNTLGGDAGSYTVVVTNALGSVTSDPPAVLTVWDPPVITAAPVGGTNLAGATVVLSVEAAGMEPLSYQWYRDVTNALSDGDALMGSASNVLSLVNVLGADDGAYTVVVSNVAGIVTSTPPAVLRVIDPLITAEPVSRTNFAGSAAVFSVQAYGTSPQYQWYKNGEPVSGVTRAELVLARVTDEDAGGYSVVVGNAYGSVRSITAILTVWDPPVITAAPAGSTNLAGTTVVLSVQAIGTQPLGYQWYRDVTNALSDGPPVMGSASNILSLVNVLGADGGAYSVVVSNEAGTVTSTPPAVLTVIDPVITAQPASRTNQTGSAAVFSVQANGTAPQYQWYKNGELVTAGTQAELVLAAVADGDAGGYSVVVSNAYGSVSSDTAILTVWDPPVITAAPAGSTNLAGATVVMSVQAVGTQPLSYQWFRDVTNALSRGAGLIGSASNVLSLVNVLGADGGAYTVVVSNEAGAVTSTPPAVLAVIDPVITAQPADRTNHAGSVAVFSVQAYGTAPEYQWYKDGELLSGGTQAELVLAAVTDGDAGGYSVVVSNAYGSVTSSMANLAVVPPLVIEYIAMGDDSVTIGWSAVPGQTYLLQSKGNLEDTNWTPVLPTVKATATSVLVTNALKDSTQEFYRAMLVP